MATKPNPKNVKMKSLLEGFAWERSERQFGKPLPTLEDIQKAYQAKHNITEEAVSQLMSDPAVKSKVEMVIKTLQSIDIDGETMQYILEKVGMDEQLQHQLTPGGIR